MTSIRERTEEQEARILDPKATLSRETRGREREEPECPVRTAFQRDRDRVIHSKAFRRLKGKTQVFFSPSGDHYRTRLTHTLEVSQIARTMARALRLNEDLTEAIALGHDLGHTPFGHAGEAALADLLPGGFHHARQSLRIVTRLEKHGRGLNLTEEVREGILEHSKGTGEVRWTAGGSAPSTLEAELVRFADIIAYLNHDLDDALRAGLLREGDVPAGITDVIGRRSSARIHSFVMGVLETTEPGSEHVAMDEERYAVMIDLRSFMYDRVYLHADVTRELDKAKGILRLLWDALVDREELRREIIGGGGEEDVPRRVADFLAGMSDAYAVSLHERLYVPKRWYQG